MVGLSVAVVCFGASAFPSVSAGAEQVVSAQSQVHALAAAAATSAARIRQLTLAYQQDNTEASALTTQVQADQARMAQLRSRVSATRSALQQDAIVGYTGGDATSTAVGGGIADPAIRAEYLEVAAGNLTQTVDQYRTAELAVASAEAGLQSDLHRSQLAAAATDQARSEAEAEAATVQNELDQAQITLTRLVNEQAAQQAAAAQASVTATYQSSGTTQGLPVNNGLETVVRSVVTPTTTTAPPAPAPTSSPPAGATQTAGGVWLQLRECESGDNYRENTGNGFYGAYQFSASTWTGLGYPGRPDQEPPAMQDAAAQKLQAEAGWGQWPACSAALGLS